MKRLAFAFLLAGLPHLSPAAVTIDSFDVGEITLTTSGSTMQEGLDTVSVAAGRRSISAGADPFEARVNTTASEFRFWGGSFGGFNLTYIFDAGSEIDLMADGSTAFRVIFSDVTPGLYRGRYLFTVDDVLYRLSEELFALDGPGVIDIPFSYFTQSSSFAPSSISISGQRTEPGYTFAISSIATIPEPQTALLVGVGAAFLTLNGRTRRGWATRYPAASRRLNPDENPLP
jgi:hypothetical protein